MSPTEVDTQLSKQRESMTVLQGCLPLHGRAGVECCERCSVPDTACKLSAAQTHAVNVPNSVQQHRLQTTNLILPLVLQESQPMLRTNWKADATLGKPASVLGQV